MSSIILHLLGHRPDAKNMGCIMRKDAFKLLQANVASKRNKQGNGDSLQATDNAPERMSWGLGKKESKVQNLLQLVALLLAARGKVSGRSGWLSGELSLLTLAARKARVSVRLSVILPGSAMFKTSRWWRAITRVQGDLKESLLALDAGLAAATVELAGISIPERGNSTNEPQSSHIMEEQISAALQPFMVYYLLLLPCNAHHHNDQ